MVGLLLDVTLAALANLPVPVNGTIDVDVPVTASANVPAQGYRVSGFIMVPKGANGGDDTATLLIDRLHKLEMPKRDICMPFPGFGFVGNELAAESAEGDAVVQATGTTNATTDGKADWNMAGVRSYSGDFATRDAANAAVALIKGAKARSGGIQPVLFDCSEALKQTRLDALAKAQEQVEQIATGLRMHVAGITKIDFTPRDATTLLTGWTVFAPVEDSDKVSVGAAATVTFRLTK